MMTLISLIAGVLAAQFLEDVGLRYMLDKIEDEDYYELQTRDCLDRLEDFIQEKQVTEDNIELLVSWAQKEKTYTWFSTRMWTPCSAAICFP